MYQVSFKNVKRHLGYEIRLKCCDNTDDAAKAITTIPGGFFLRKTDKLKREMSVYSISCHELKTLKAPTYFCWVKYILMPEESGAGKQDDKI